MTSPLHPHGHRTPYTCVVNSNRCQRCIFIFFSRPTSNHDGPVQDTCRPEPLVVPKTRAIFEKRILRCSVGTHRPLDQSETMTLFEINEWGKNYARGRLFAVGAFAVLGMAPLLSDGKHQKDQHSKTQQNMMPKNANKTHDASLHASCQERSIGPAGTIKMTLKNQCSPAIKPNKSLHGRDHI